MKKKLLSQKLMAVLLSSAVVAGTLTVATPEQTYAASNAKVYTELTDDIQDGVILHCFDWTYQQIIDELPNIKAAGFSSIQTSPAQVAVVGNSIWYYLYQPNTFTIGNSGLGSEEDLKRLCREADKYGIKVIVDVVANHLAGDHDNIDPELMGSSNWHNEAGKINYSNRHEITHRDIGMPDLNSENWFVQQKVKNYIQTLKADGVDGIRWDAAKHISLPSEGCGFWSTVIDKDMYNYGEILDTPVADSPYGYSDFAKNLMCEYTDYMSVTDSDYSATVTGAFKEGNVPTGFGNWVTVEGVDNDEVVYWGESHDTYSNNTDEGGWTKYLSQNIIDRAYAVVGSRNDITALYFSRPSQTAKTSIMVGKKGSTHFKSAEVAAVNHLHNACNGQRDYYGYDKKKNVAIVTREKGATLVLGSGGNQYVSVANAGNLAEPGTYIDEVSGNPFTVTKDKIEGTIGSTGIAVFYKFDDDPIIDKPVVSSDKETQTFKDSITVNYSITDATSYEITVNGVKNNALCQTYTATTAVTVSATNSAGTTTKSYTFTKDSSKPDPDPGPIVTTTIYVDTTSCSWFGNDNAVAAIKTNKDSSYKRMTTTTIDGKKVYTLAIPKDATSATIVRMLPSGQCYNEKSISLNSSVNFYTSDSNWSNLKTSYYGQQDPKPITKMVTVYLTNNYNWNNVYAYTWGGSKNTEKWPGSKMTYVRHNEYGQAVYKIEVAKDVKGLVFTNGTGSQTVDITSGIQNNAGFYITGSNGKCTVGTYTFK